MSARGLIDTGAMLALLDRKDAWHGRCVAVFAEIPLPLATSAAVLAELFHLLGDEPNALACAWGLLRSGAITVLPVDDSDLPVIEALMKKYADRPMDFADATLVYLAQREALSTVFTVDRQDFEIYRVAGKRRLRVVPEA